MPPHDLAQTASHAVPDHGAADAFRGHEAGAERLRLSDLQRRRARASAPRCAFPSVRTRANSADRVSRRAFGNVSERARLHRSCAVSSTTADIASLISIARRSYSKSLPGREPREDFAKLVQTDYGAACRAGSQETTWSVVLDELLGACRRLAMDSRWSCCARSSSQETRRRRLLV